MGIFGDKGINRFLRVRFDEAAGHTAERQAQQSIRRAVDPAAANRALGQIRTEIGGLNGGLGKMAALGGAVFGGMAAMAQGAVHAVVGLGRAVAAAAIDLAKLGMDIGETRSKFDTVFGDASASLREWTATYAILAGQTRNEAEGFLATTGAIAQGMGMAKGASADFAQEIFKLAADLQSFNNIPFEQGILAINRALTGERESLTTLGIVINEADVQMRALTNTHKKHADELSRTEKATATLQLITERAGVAVGDLDRTQSSSANTTRRVIATLRQYRDDIAEGILPVVVDLTHRLAEWMDKNQAAFRQGVEDAVEFGVKLGELIEKAGHAIVVTIKFVDNMVQWYNGLPGWGKNVVASLWGGGYNAEARRALGVGPGGAVGVGTEYIGDVASVTGRTARTVSEQGGLNKIPGWWDWYMEQGGFRSPRPPAPPPMTAADSARAAEWSRRFGGGTFSVGGGGNPFANMADQLAAENRAAAERLRSSLGPAQWGPYRPPAEPEDPSARAARERREEAERAKAARAAAAEHRRELQAQRDEVAFIGMQAGSRQLSADELRRVVELERSIRMAADETNRPYGERMRLLQEANALRLQALDANPDEIRFLEDSLERRRLTASEIERAAAMEARLRAASQDANVPYTDRVKLLQEANALRLVALGINEPEIAALREAAEWRVLSADEMETLRDQESRLAEAAKDTTLEYSERNRLMRESMDLFHIITEQQQPLGAILWGGAEDYAQDFLNVFSEVFDFLNEGVDAWAASWERAFELIWEGSSDTADVLTVLGRTMGAGLLGGLRSYALAEMKKEAAAAVSEVAAGFGEAALGNAGAAALHFKSAAHHGLAVAAWGIAAGAAGGGAGALANTESGSAGGAQSTRSAGQSSESDRFREPQRELHFYVNPWDRNNPVQQVEVAGMIREIQERFGGNDSPITLSIG